MRTLAWAPLMLLSGLALPFLLRAGDSGGRAQYVGGTVSTLTGKSEGHIQLTDEEAFYFRRKDGFLRVPYTRIHTIEYGQRVSRRYASAILISPVLLLAKKRRHFLTVGFTDERGSDQAMVLEVHKDAIRAVLAGLEIKTGRRVAYQDEEARKAGKG
jgi:hypothetical protein